MLRLVWSEEDCVCSSCTMYVLLVAPHVVARDLLGVLLLIYCLWYCLFYCLCCCMLFDCTAYVVACCTACCIDHAVLVVLHDVLLTSCNASCTARCTAHMLYRRCARAGFRCTARPRTRGSTPLGASGSCSRRGTWLRRTRRRQQTCEW